MVSTMIACGPFSAKKVEDAAEIVFPVHTQGDWVNTEEGNEKLAYALTGLESAAANKVLPNNMIVDWRSEDEFVVTLPCENMEKALKLLPEIKDKIPFITNAVPKESTRKVGM
jgi:hypothetical protein